MKIWKTYLNNKIVISGYQNVPINIKQRFKMYIYLEYLTYRFTNN